MENNIQLPLEFFESFITDRGFEKFIRERINDFVDYSGYHIVKIDQEKMRVIHWDLDEHGQQTKEYIYTPERELKSLLTSEFKSAKKLLNLANIHCATEKKDFIAFLKSQEKTLQFIINKSSHLINKYPILYKPIEEIVNYINDKFLSDSQEKISLDTSALNFNVEDVEELETDEEILTSILGYMKGYNEKRKKIMSDEQFDLMMKYVKDYVSNEKIPEITKRIEPIKISKNLLRFTFWVLHKNLYTSRPYRADFLQMVKDMFVDFDTWEFTTLKIKFGNKDKVTHFGKHFIPGIIKSELRGR